MRRLPLHLIVVAESFDLVSHWSISYLNIQDALVEV